MKAPSSRDEQRISGAASQWVPRSGSPQARAISYVAARSAGDVMDSTLRVTLNFHPDRPQHGALMEHSAVPEATAAVAGRGFATILHALAADGVYRSQFETGTSNGGLTAHPGGQRWSWESRIFGSAYDAASASERPKYGALNYRRRPSGASPRFGSSHLRLRPEVLTRCTFCYPDSVFDPTQFGVASRMGLVALAEADVRDPLDDYVEAHVHGPVRLADDVEALVLDPSFQGTDVEDLARALPCPLEWHAGFQLDVDVLRRHPTYRGPEYVALGVALAQDGVITPAILGEAARTGKHDPQNLKRVWHYLARFGYRAAD